MKLLSLTVIFLMLLIMSSGSAQVTSDVVSQAASGLNISPLGDVVLDKLQQNLSATGREVIQNVSEANRKIIQNASAAGQDVIENLGLNQESLEARAKEELKRQAQEKLEQPGFECTIAVAGICGVFLLLRRRC